MNEIPRPGKIKAVIFDWGDVMMTYEGLYRECASSFGVDETTFKRVFDKYCPDFENGEDEMKIWHNVANDLGAKTPEKPIWLEAFTKVYKINEEMFSYAEQLQRLGYRVGLITNTEIPLMQFIKKQRNSKYKIFDRVAYSCEPEIMQRKPGRKIFDVALRRLGISEGEAIFIDDKEEYVNAARQLGLKGVVYQNPNQAIGETNGLLKVA